jgi:probable F420-dependent oxidoreductase
MTQRYGITIPFEGKTLQEHRDLFRRVADAGYTDLWSAEVDGLDGFTPLTLAAAWEPELQLGVAITPVYTRGPALLAMSIAAMAEAAPGRFTMGLGASSLPIVERWNGIPFDEPFKKTRDVLRFVTRALDGEKIDEEFATFTVKGFKLARPVTHRPPILLGALRPGMLRLAGTEADGAILNWLSASDVPTCTEHVGAHKSIAARLFVIPTEDADTARFIGRRMISSYLTVPTYAGFHRWLGRGERLQPMWDAWAAGDRKAANALIPDDVVDELIIHGNYDQCREHVQRYIEAGIQIPTLAVIPIGVDITEAIAGLAPRP